MQSEVGARTHNRHVPPEGINELRELVKGCLPEKLTKAENPGILLCRLLSLILPVMDMHRAVFQDNKGTAIHAISGLLEQKGPGRLDLLNKPDGQGEWGQDKYHHRQ
jgi:hypothetical protein